MAQLKLNYNFQCDLCDAILSRKDKLNRHMKIHTGVKFECTECEVKYSRNDRLTRHLKSKHPSLKKKKLSTMSKKLRKHATSKEKIEVAKVFKSENPRAKRTDLPSYSRTHKKKNWNNRKSKSKAREMPVEHKINNHSAAELSYNEVDKHSEEGVFAVPLEINSNYEDIGEIIIDALYLKGDQLYCRAANMECFQTDSVFEMKAHREKYHVLLEQRFSFETWRHLLPERCFISVNIEKNKSINRKPGDIDIIEKIKNARTAETNVTQENINKTIEHPIRKEFSDYLVKLRSRRIGQ